MPFLFWEMEYQTPIMLPGEWNANKEQKEGLRIMDLLFWGNCAHAPCTLGPVFDCDLEKHCSHAERAGTSILYSAAFKLGMWVSQVWESLDVSEWIYSPSTAKTDSSWENKWHTVRAQCWLVHGSGVIHQSLWWWEPRLRARLSIFLDEGNLDQTLWAQRHEGCISCSSKKLTSTPMHDKLNHLSKRSRVVARHHLRAIRRWAWFAERRSGLWKLLGRGGIFSGASRMKDLDKWRGRGE
jgi:hypothetical protein